MPKLNVIRSPELTPFWRRPPERYAGELPDHTDVLVIGGGITGVADSYAVAVLSYGRARAHEIWDMTLVNHATMIEAVAGRPVGHRRMGSAILASGAEEAASLAESAELLNEDGFEASWDGRTLVNPLDGEVDPAAVVGALARQAPPEAIREGVNVTAIEARSNEVLVHANGAECHAGCVILATNAYTP